MAQFQEFCRMMDELDLAQIYLPTLIENGFEEWSTIIELNMDLLSQIGIEDEFDAKQVLACINAAKLISDPSSKYEQEPIFGKII